MSAWWALLASSSMWIPVSKNVINICIVKYKITYFLPFQPFFFVLFLGPIIANLRPLIGCFIHVECLTFTSGWWMIVASLGGMMVSGDGGDNSGDSSGR